MTAWDTAPVLTEADVDELLVQSSMADASGIAPESAGWEPTYDLNTAAAAGWLIKAGRVSDQVEADPSGSGIFTSKVFDNCCRMARIYRSKNIGTLTVK